MRKLITSLALVLSALSSYAITPLWMRDARISPDGSEIVFCYKGDIYKVPAQGGTAVQLTTQTSYEANPVWSPDGKQIAFASDRNGNFDLFIMPADGGAARRLTYHLHQKYRRLLLRMESMSFSLPLYRIRQAVPCFLQER